MSLEDIVKSVREGDFKLLVIDSIQHMRLTPNDIKILRQRCPEVAILGIMQSTKDGNYRGSTEYEHGCDIFLKAQNGNIIGFKTRGQASIEIPIQDFMPANSL